MEKKRKIQLEKDLLKRIRKRQRAVAGRSENEEDSRTFFPEGTSDEILDIEVAQLLSQVNNSQDGNQSEQAFSAEEFAAKSPYEISQRLPKELQQEVELEIVALSSTGDGLAYNDEKNHIFIVPFSIPGDRVLAKPHKWNGNSSFSDFIKVIRPSPSREGATPQCKYFEQCSGCQFQMIPYEKQLEHKREVVVKAYQNFSGLRPDQIPEVQPTMGSPLQYKYRTKLSPHFTFPARWNPRPRNVPAIGYNMKGRNKVMDIESCPIGTDILQEGLRIERERTIENLQDFRKGKTINLRESTSRVLAGTAVDPAGSQNRSIPSDPSELVVRSKELIQDKSGHPRLQLTYDDFIDIKTYTANEKGLVTEYITTTIDPKASPPVNKTYKFVNEAGSFFQNNNSILGPFTSYVYAQCIPPVSSASPQPKIKYLLDAYSGSGLFTLTLSPLFKSSLGIDIDARSIIAANNNATINNVQNAGFIDADASALFADVPYPAEETLVVIDPPRRGCDREFLKQLRRFGPGRVIYVSCNVHTQARDVGVMVNGFGESNKKWEEQGLAKYEVESLRGFDFFPQTHHVEGVCVLNRIAASADTGREGPERRRGSRPSEQDGPAFAPFAS